VVRTKDLVKVKGMLINPAVLLETLRRIPEVDEFQVAVRREVPTDPLSMDELVVRVATHATDRDTLARTITACTRAAVQVRPRVEFASADEIYDPARQTKAVRFTDER
jgi:phenylacetate-coenzyme A ligase PaaK-like adenylate-forming protein